MITMVLLMLLQTAMLAFSQVTLKLAMEGMHWEWSWSFIWHNVILNGWLMLAVTLMIGANLFWLWMLHKYPLSQVKQSKHQPTGAVTLRQPFLAVLTPFLAFFTPLFHMLILLRYRYNRL